MIPWLNIKGVSQDEKYSGGEHKKFGQEKKKPPPQKEKVSLSLKDGKDKEGEPAYSKTSTDKKGKEDNGDDKKYGGGLCHEAQA